MASGREWGMNALADSPTLHPLARTSTRHRQASARARRPSSGRRRTLSPPRGQSSRGPYLFLLPLLCWFWINGHEEDGAGQRLAEGVQAEGAGGAAVQRIIQDEVERLNIVELVAHNLAPHERAKMALDTRGGGLRFQFGVGGGCAGDEADVGDVAFVALAAIGEVVEAAHWRRRGRLLLGQGHREPPLWHPRRWGIVPAPCNARGQPARAGRCLICIAYPDGRSGRAGWRHLALHV